MVIPIPLELNFERMPTFEDELLSVVEEYQIKGTILSSDPALVSFLDHPLVTLDGMEFAPAIYQQQRNKYQLLFVNDCDLICAPHDKACEKSKENLLEHMAAENREVFKKTVKKCTYIIYVPKND